MLMLLSSLNFSQAGNCKVDATEGEGVKPRMGILLPK